MLANIILPPKLYFFNYYLLSFSLNVHYQSKVFKELDFNVFFKEFSSAQQALHLFDQNTAQTQSNLEIFLLFKITAFYLNIF